MTQKLLKTILILLAVASPSFAQTTPPQTLESQGGAGDLLIAPTRVVLEGRMRAGEIILSSRASKDATYRISLTHLRMKEDGSYEEISEQDAKNSIKTADDLLRYSPRQVTLKPGESQVVKVMLRKPEGLADGEYTSHMLFRAVPDDLATGENVEAQTTQGDQISIKLIPVYGVSIPVLVRVGETAMQSSLALHARSADSVTLVVGRNGTRSVYGDITITQGKPDNVVGILKGVSVLSYLSKRQVTIPLTNATAAPLTAEYRERAEDGGKQIGTLAIP